MPQLKNPVYRVIEVPLAHKTLVEAVSYFFYAAGYVNDDEEIINIEFSPDGQTLTKLKVKRQQPVELIEH